MGNQRNESSLTIVWMGIITATVIGMILLTCALGWYFKYL